MTQLRIGIIGAGGISTMTSREFAANPNAGLCAVADPSAERATRFAARYGIAQVHDDARAVFDDPTIDAVYIGVPNRFHAELATAALIAGKHVLLDKPFALSSNDAETVADAARAGDRVFMLGMNQRFSPDAQTARVLVRDGVLGEVYHAKAYWRRRSGIPRIGSWFTHRDTSGGGALLDIGVHMLDVALHVMDNFDAATVSGASYTRMGDRGLGDGGWGLSEREHDAFDVDDFATALIRLRNGASISLDAAWAVHQTTRNDMGVDLYGTEAGLHAYDNALLTYGDSPGEYTITQHPYVEELPYPHCSRVDHFVNVILGTEAPLVTLDEALTVQRILDAIYESSATGREVAL